MKSFNNYIAEQEDSEKKGKKISVGKSTVKINPNKDELKEGGDWWHPDPEKDKKLPGVGPKMRAREDRASAKEDPKKLRPGESYMDYAKRQQRSESAVPGKPAERLGAVTAIPQSERDAARERTLAKAKAARAAREKGMKEEFEIEEGMTMKDFKKNRSRQKQKDKREAEKTSPLRRAGIHDDKASPERAARHRANVDPDYDRDDDEDMYPGGKLKNPKKIRKAKATGEITKEETEMLSFSDFMEARRMDKEGVDRGDTLRANRTARAKASVEAVKKRQAALDKHEKKTGTKLDISRSKEGQAHARNHPGSRQAPKVKGEKETALQTHNRRVNRQVSRVIKHGHTTKEKEANRGIYSSRFD
jgi:hypothetical protein